MQLKSPSVGDAEVRRPRGVQKDDVWTAADAILLEGGKPTIERVRQRLGTGSPNTVGPLLETWFKSLGQRLRSQEDPDASDGVPGPVMQAAHQLWKAALAQTQEDFEERVHQGLADAVANVEAEKEKAHIASSAAFEATANANRLEMELDDCRRLLQQVQQDLAAERASAQEVRAALAKEQDRLVEERHSAAEQLADLKVQLVAAIQRADAADRGIASPADLRGKRIGYVRGTSGHYFTDTFLTYHGITLDQITPVELDAARAPQQLAAGEVDAAGLYQPHGPEALRLLGSQGRVLSAPRLYTATMNLVVRPGVSDADAVKLLRALQRANAYMQADQQRAQAQVARELRLDPASVRESWDLLSFRLSMGQSLLTTLEAQSRWMRRTEQVEGTESPDFLKMMRPGPLRQVDPSAVSLVN